MIFILKKKKYFTGIVKTLPSHHTSNVRDKKVALKWTFNLLWSTSYLETHPIFPQCSDHTDDNGNDNDDSNDTTSDTQTNSNRGDVPICINKKHGNLWHLPKTNSLDPFKLLAMCSKSAHLSVNFQ